MSNLPAVEHPIPAGSIGKTPFDCCIAAIIFLAIPLEARPHNFASTFSLLTLSSTSGDFPHLKGEKLHIKPFRII
ncbi:hypothetical protein I308_105391 [Cryptococcus tetragattii IND107]|uniref:Uncharacterized protein n=1 Tax=Cryptococcus tetragattii IND107 TaxID=1296105 RepID=A0ABR3BKU8_9TREE